MSVNFVYNRHQCSKCSKIVETKLLSKFRIYTVIR